MADRRLRGMPRRLRWVVLSFGVLLIAAQTLAEPRQAHREQAARSEPRQQQARDPGTARTQSAQRQRNNASEARANRGRGTPAKEREQQRVQHGREEFRTLSSAEQRRLRETQQRYRQLEPQQREQLRQRWEHMSADERARYRRQAERAKPANGD